MAAKRKTFYGFICTTPILWFFLISCGAGQTDESMLNYTETAEKQFQEAMDEFDDEDCVAADPMFQDIRRKYPYSRFAVLSELRIADCQFMQGNHAEAAVSYHQFTKTHPTHPEAHYAAFRRALCYYESIPGDWIVTPPPHERDQAATRDARAAFSLFIEKYPTSPHLELAIELLSLVEDALVRHEIYVAEFYLSRNDRRAAVVRLEGIRNNFPQSNLVPDAMFMQAVTFLQMNQAKKAQSVFNEIITHYPKHYQGLRAKDYLRHLDSQTPDAKRGTNG